jgi:nicotine blue oxidoreductase
MVAVKVAAVVLAAGEGRRMGGPRALLRAGPESFLARCVELLSRPGVAPVIAVLGHEFARVSAEAGLGPGVWVVENAGYREGMLSSILRGLDEAERAGADALLLHPVDHPLVSPETVDRVVAALESGAQIAVPSHEGRRGHPAGFARSTWLALRAASPQRGARGLLTDHPDWVVHVPGDAGCLAGFDTPDDLLRYHPGP